MKRYGATLTIKDIFNERLNLIDNDEGYIERNIYFEQNKPEDVIDDFKDFFDLFVNGKSPVNQFKNTQIQQRYIEQTDSTANDSYAKGFIGAQFLSKHNLI